MYLNNIIFLHLSIWVPRMVSLYSACIFRERVRFRSRRLFSGRDWFLLRFHLFCIFYLRDRLLLSFIDFEVFFRLYGLLLNTLMKYDQLEEHAQLQEGVSHIWSEGVCWLAYQVERDSEASTLARWTYLDATKAIRRCPAFWKPSTSPKYV